MSTRPSQSTTLRGARLGILVSAVAAAAAFAAVMPGVDGVQETGAAARARDASTIGGAGRSTHSIPASTLRDPSLPPLPDRRIATGPGTESGAGAPRPDARLGYEPLTGGGGLVAHDWKIVKPSNTGIPGEEVSIVRWAPDGRLWVGARWPFWHEGGLGVLDPATGIWTVYSNWETPIPSEFINDLAFGPGGVVWIATDEGLVKKDGDVWTVFNTSNAPFLHNSILNIDLAPNGHLWVNNSNYQTSAGAVLEYDGTIWRRFQVGQQLPWSPPWGALSNVMVDHNGHVWVANQVLNGVAEYNGLTWTLRGSGVDRFDAIMEDHAGNLWLRAGVGGYDAFYKYDHTTFTRYDEPTTPTSMTVDAAGAVYLANWLGEIRKTTNGGGTWTNYLSGLNPVFQIAPRAGSGEMWIGTQGAVGQFGADGFWKRDYNTYNTGMPWYWVDAMSKDREGNFWIATGEAGLSRFDGARWRNWGMHNAGSEPYPFYGNEPMSASYEDRDGAFWMGGNGIARWNASSGSFSGFWNWENNPNMGPTLFPWFAEDAAGHLFAADQDAHVYHFDGTLWNREPISPYVMSSLPGMKADSQGNIWVTGSFSLHRWDGQQWSLVGDEWLFWDWGGVTAFAIGPDDILWIGTPHGLGRWDGVSLQLFDRTNSPLPAVGITGIAVREDGTVGVAASDFDSVTPFPGGVALIKGDAEAASSWTVWSYGASPLPHYQLGAVGFDPQGALWVSALSEGAAVVPGCSSAGWINIVRRGYVCGANAEIAVTDCDLDTDARTVESLYVRVTSPAEPAGEMVRLTEIAPNAGVFLGSVRLSAVDAPGVLKVADGDSIQASYFDASDGAGGQNIVRTDTAAASCALVRFPQTLRAIDKVTFGWTAPADVHWVRGRLSQLPTYRIDDYRSAAASVSIPAQETPSAGAGFYYLVRPDDPHGSWSSNDPGECPPGQCAAGGADGNLPTP